MVLQILDRCRGFLALEIRAACVGRPDRVGDLSAHQFAFRVSGAKRGVSLALGQVDVTIGENELDPDVGMSCVETFDES